MLKSVKFKIFIVFFIVVAIAIVVFYRDNKTPAPQNEPTGLIIGKNAIYVAEQPPGQNIIVSVVQLEKSGFAVIHEDAAGAPGKILGAGKLLSAGETKNPFTVALSRAAQDDETVYAMLHLDNGDGKFNAADDKPIIDPIGNEPVMMVITVSRGAVLPSAVSP